MAIKCPQCGAEYDVTLFTFGRSIRCDCGACVDLAVGHQQISEDGTQAVSSEASRACMSSEKPTVAPARKHRGFLWLVVVHLVMGMTGASVTYFVHPSMGIRFHPSQLVAGVFVGLVLSQTSLLGIWSSIGRSPWWKKVIGVVAGVGYLSPLMGTGTRANDFETLVLVVATTSFVAMPLLIVRSMRVAIHLDFSPTEPLGRIQFSIRHLLVLMFAVGCLISIGELIRDHLDDAEIFTILLSIALTSGVVGVLPVWCVLATKRPIPYSIGLVIVGACAGYCFGLAYSGGVIVWTIITATEAAAVIVSLLVVRSYGYRLVRLPREMARGSRLDEFTIPHISNQDSQSGSVSN